MMLQLNQRTYATDEREFEYELPRFLTKCGKEKGFLKVRVRPFDESAEAMRQAGERVIRKGRIKGALIRKWKDARYAEVKDPLDDTDPKVLKIETELVEREDAAMRAAQNRFARDCLEHCILSWDSNIWNAEAKAVVDQTPEMFGQLIDLAFPETETSRNGEIAAVLTEMCEDIARLAVQDEIAASDFDEADRKN